MSKTDNKELEEAIQILDKFANNEMQRDKLERDNRCGGWKIGDIFKHLELNIAITTVLKELKRLQEENKKMEIEIANHVYWESTPVNEIKKMYIPKDKIREKIEELNKNRDMISGGYAISILEELLEGK